MRGEAERMAMLARALQGVEEALEQAGEVGRAGEIERQGRTSAR